MGWAIAQHRGFAREFGKLEAADADVIRAALSRVRDQLERVGSLDPRKIFSSGMLDRVSDLQPLRCTGLRVGRHRVALAILPDERLVLLTVVARRDESTYDKLPDLHRKRFADR